VTSQRSSDTCHARHPRYSLCLSPFYSLSLSDVLIQASLFATLRKLVGSPRIARQRTIAPGTQTTRIDLIPLSCILPWLILINRALKWNKRLKAAGISRRCWVYGRESTRIPERSVTKGVCVCESFELLCYGNVML